MTIEDGIKKGYFGVRFSGKTATSVEVNFIEFSDGYKGLELNWSGGLSGYNKTGMDEEEITDIIKHFGVDSKYRVFGEVVSGGYFLTYNFFPLSEIGKNKITAVKVRRKIGDSEIENQQ